MEGQRLHVAAGHISRRLKSRQFHFLEPGLLTIGKPGPDTLGFFTNANIRGLRDMIWAAGHISGPQ